MKQVVQDIRTGQTRVIEVPVPQTGPGMALVRTAASLVSAGTERTLVEFASKSLLGKARARPDLVRQTLDKARREGIVTTLEAVQNRLDQPMPLGYSSAGTIIALGQGMAGFAVGDRVAAGGLGYAVHGEYGVVPRNLLARLPDEVDFEAGAFATLGAIALHGFRLAEPGVGDRVAVIGLGLLGLLAAGIARAAGCRVLGIDVDESRVGLALDLGIQAIQREGAEDGAASRTQGLGFDSVLVCAHAATSDPVELAGRIARDRAAIVAVGAVGLNLPRRTYYEKELRFIVSRSYGPGRYDPAYEEAGQDYPIGYVRWTEARNLEAFVQLLAQGRVEVRSLITHRFRVDEAPRAYQLITEGREPFLGVLLSYPGEMERREPMRLVRVSEHPSAPSGRVRLGALGAGTFASGVLFPALRKVEGVDLIGVATSTGLKGSSVARRFGFRYATTDEGEILADEHVNVVAVLTRHHLHARQTAAALRAGKHVMCEKPLAVHREELVQVARAVQESGRLLTVGFNRRFAPLALRLREFVVAANSPMIMHYRVNAGPLPHSHWLLDPAQGGGRIIGEACHFIDFLTFLTGSLPVRVDAAGLKGETAVSEENVLISVTFADGSLGSIVYVASGDRALPKERVEVFGGGRAAVLDDFRRLDLVSGGRRRKRAARLRQDKGHAAIWDAFAAAVSSGGPPPIPLDHLYAVTLASFAAVESLRSGVGIPIVPLTLDE
jgi:predicted dehydrogenase/threonine dehydrogenase-like Zn-dependent dehydrogenase